MAAAKWARLTLCWTALMGRCYKNKTMREFLEFVVRQLVEFPDEAIITEIPSGRTTVFRLQLRQSDVGRIIGRNGQTIQSIRALLSRETSCQYQRAQIEIVVY